MTRVRLIHWNADGAAAGIARLQKAGYDVDFEVPAGAAFFHTVKKHLPDAFVIDLTRLPSHGRDIALGLRKSKSTRAIPLVFVDGAPEKVDRVKAALPDATYTSWSRVHSSLKRAMANPPATPVVPNSQLAGYSGTPLPKKLGIKSGMVVALLGAPDGFQQTLQPLPDNVLFRHQARGKCDLIIWFAASAADLKRRILRLGAAAGSGGLWVAWPKKASGITTDLTQTMVREVGLASGLVDYKICAIDQTWSGLKFTQRK
jgi:CheY-like chemotaxis protein